MKDLDVSIIVPAKNESENLRTLVPGIAEACAETRFEIIVVDDGSDDNSLEILQALSEIYQNVRVLQHAESAGQSAAVHSGVLHAHGRIICTLDGDGQNPPSELPKLYGPLLEKGASPKLGLIAGQRVGRQDTMSKKIASRAANRIRVWMLKDATRDTGCGLKGFRKDAFLQLPYFNHMHRYLPALFKRAGWEVGHVDVAHKARSAGVSKYTNLQRAFVGITDLMGVAWLQRRAKAAQPSEIEFKK